MTITFTSTDNNMNSLFENYEFEYKLFLIESSTFSTCGKIDIQCIQESGDLELIQESIKETLTVWVNRFTEALQNALNKFIQIIEGAQDLTYLRSIEPNVKGLTGDTGLTVNNIRNYDNNFMQNFNVVKFNDVFTTKKESLQNQDQFLIQNYSNLGFTEGKTDIKQVIEEHVVEIVKDPVNVDKPLVLGYYDWCRNNYKNDLGSIQNLMNTYNESTKAILNIINNLPDDYRDKQQTEGNNLVTPKNNQQQQTPQNASYNFLLTEAPNDGTPNQVTPNPVNSTQTNNNNNNDNNKMTFEKRVDNVANSKGESNQETVNAIRVYLSTTTRILSTLFIIVKNRKADYMRVLKQLFPMNREQKQTAQSTVNLNRTQGQIDTSNIPTNG